MPIFIKRAFTAVCKKKCIFLHFFYKNIWSYQKKAVPLHSLLRNKCVSIFYRKFRTLKFRFTYVDLIFLRQTEG